MFDAMNRPATITIPASRLAATPFCVNQRIIAAR
jgi:hypothetical protein